MAKVNQRVAISKYLMKEGLLRLLKKKHINKISVSELCQEAQINRTTFYRYYQTPQDILQEIALDYVKEFSDQAGSAKKAEDIKAYVMQLCIFLHDRADMVKLFMRNDTGVDFSRIFQMLSEEFLGARTVLYRGRAVDDATLRLMNTFFSSGIYALIRQWLMEDISKTPEEIADLLSCSFHMDFSFE